ncbi:MAG: 8-oxo-dGTP diphosphatase MutT [Pseudomonadota bacterium]
MAKSILFVAAAALVDSEGRVLICQRPQGKQLAGLWEFPGGKVEPGETPEECLIRELDEELGIKVTHACLAPFVFASHGYESFHLMMPLYLVRRWEGFVTAKEHEAVAWVKPANLADYPMPPADAPLVAWLRDLI